VRTNAEAHATQEALTAYGVESVLHSGDDIFASEEARETALLLAAVEKPGKRDLVKAALLTRYFSLTGKDLPHDKLPETLLCRFRTYHSLWARSGFMQMFWAVLRDNGVRSRLLGTPTGERSLTNILHLAEILHREASGRSLNMAGLQNFLRERLGRETPNVSEHQLRLESDNDRVKIVTIHKAKGLEYPVVFCPSSWEGARLRPETGFFFHQTYRQAAAREELAENLRLLYVALTRAMHRCYLFWGPIRGAETSAPAYLLHQGRGGTSAGHLLQGMETVQSRFQTLSGSGIVSDLQDLVAASGKSIRLAREGGAGEPYQAGARSTITPLEPRRFTPTVGQEWKISSFSSLTGTSGPAGGSYRDRDAAPSPAGADAATGPESAGRTLFSFPRGAKAGTLLHEILERLDYTLPPAAAAEFIDVKLLHFGYDPAWAPAILQLVADLQELELHREIPGLRLGAIGCRDLLHELEFYFPLARMTPELLRQIFCASGNEGDGKERGGSAPRLEIQPPRRRL
jgi:exodeoxyribonuclease V beta subunit